jgi:hypothetical protein
MWEPFKASCPHPPPLKSQTLIERQPRVITATSSNILVLASDKIALSSFSWWQIFPVDLTHKAVL